MSVTSTPLRGSASASHRPAFVERSIETRYATIAVRESRGGGCPLLFLHGNSSSKNVFDLQLESSIGANRHCIAVDLPGHGASSDARDPKRAYSISGYADAVSEALEALGIDQVTVVGWSLGGHVAIELMASFPGVVGAMICGTPPIGIGLRDLLRAFRFGPSARRLTAGRLSDEQMMALARATVGVAHAADAIDDMRRADPRARERLLRSLVAGDHADQRAFVESAEIPLAVVAGANDPILRTGYLGELEYGHLWDGQCHLIAGAGHAPFLDAPAVFNLLLTRFAIDMDERAAHLLDQPRLVFSG